LLPSSNHSRADYLALRNGRGRACTCPASHPKPGRDEPCPTISNPLPTPEQFVGYAQTRPITANMPPVFALVFCCALLAAPVVGQENVDLAKLAVQLKDKDFTVRQSAIEVLGQLKDSPAAVDLIISSLDDDNPEVRSRAALALGEMGAVKSIDRLARILQSESLRDRRSAIIALGTIGGEKACEALIPILKSPSAEERDSTAAALGEARCVRALDPLIKALSDDRYNVRASAALALGDLGDKRAVEALIGRLNDDAESVRTGVVFSLGALGDRRAIEPLEKLLKTEKKEDVRQQIDSALQRLRAVRPDKE